MPQVSACLLPVCAKEKTQYHCFPKDWERGSSASGAVNGRGEGGGFGAGVAIQQGASPGGTGGAPGDLGSQPEVGGVGACQR